MFAKELTYDGRVRRFVVVRSAGSDGWEIREEEDSAVLRRVRYSDWHRVERAMERISQQVGELEAWGWRERVPTAH